MMCTILRVSILYTFNNKTPSTHFFSNDLSYPILSINAHWACLEKKLYTDENMKGFYLDVQCAIP